MNIKNYLYGTAILSALSLLIAYGAAETKANPVATLAEHVAKSVDACPTLLNDLTDQTANTTKTSINTFIENIQTALTAVIKSAESSSKTGAQTACNDLPQDAENPEIRVINNIDQILPCVQENSLIVFDMDATLIDFPELVQFFASDWGESAEAVQERINKFTAQPNQKIDYGILINPNTLSILQRAKAVQGVHIILVSHEKINIIVTERANQVGGLKDIKNEFDALINTNFLNTQNPHGSGVKKTDEYDIQKVIKYAEITNRSMRGQLSLSKGSIILDYIKQEKLNPSNIIFVDDDKTNLEWALATDGIKEKLIPLHFIKGVEMAQLDEYRKTNKSIADLMQKASTQSKTPPEYFREILISTPAP